MEVEDPKDCTLLFNMICQAAPPVEHNEIKRVLGARIVEENEDLLNELVALSDILAAYQEETGEIRESKSKSKAFLMPDRDRLLGNIKFFVENIQRAATPVAGMRPRSTPQAFLTCSTPREQKVIEYVTHELERTQGPPETPRMAGVMRPSSRAGRPSTAPANPEPLIAKARVLELGEVKEDLRAMLREENTSLKEKVEMLRLQLEDSIDDRDRVLSEEPPTVAEIKGLESKLEMMSVQSAMPVCTALPGDLTVPTEPPSPPKSKRANQTSPKKAKAAQGRPEKPTRTVAKKPLSNYNSSLVLDCSRPSA